MRRRVHATRIAEMGSAGALQYAQRGPPRMDKSGVLASTHIDDAVTSRACCSDVLSASTRVSLYRYCSESTAPPTRRDLSTWKQSARSVDHMLPRTIAHLISVNIVILERILCASPCVGRPSNLRDNVPFL